MSNYINTVINQNTRTRQGTLLIDDCYGWHEYAVAFRKDSKLDLRKALNLLEKVQAE